MGIHCRPRQKARIRKTAGALLLIGVNTFTLTKEATFLEIGDDLASACSVLWNIDINKRGLRE